MNFNGYHVCQQGKQARLFEVAREDMEYFGRILIAKL